jgi:hypothetical protein
MSFRRSLESDPMDRYLKVSLKSWAERSQAPSGMRENILRQVRKDERKRQLFLHGQKRLDRGTTINTLSQWIEGQTKLYPFQSGFGLINLIR